MDIKHYGPISFYLFLNLADFSDRLLAARREFALREVVATKVGDVVTLAALMLRLKQV